MYQVSSLVLFSWMNSYLPPHLQVLHPVVRGFVEPTATTTPMDEVSYWWMEFPTDGFKSFQIDEISN
jgi:hypothetical protein